MDEYESELEPLAEQTHVLETIVAIRPSSSGTGRVRTRRKTSHERRAGRGPHATAAR